MDSSTQQLPDDLWFEVLSKTPAEDVVECRRLSKFHRDLIDSPEFIKKHNDLSINTDNRPRHVILSSPNTCIDHRTDFRASSLRLHRLNPPIIKHEKYKLVDSCMGILCYEVQNLDCLLLWNPLTGSSRTISLRGTTVRTRNMEYVLGHDHVANDWKVMKINKLNRNFEIYSLKTDSWKEHNFVMPIYERPVFVEGTGSVHWHMAIYVIAFNFVTQIFNQYLQPPTPANVFFLDTGVSSFGGCLSYYWYYRDSHHPNRLDVWTMKEYGADESWTRLFSISDHGGCWFPPIDVFNSIGTPSVLISSSDGLYQCEVETPEAESTKLHKKLDFTSLELESARAFSFTPSLRRA